MASGRDFVAIIAETLAKNGCGPPRECMHLDAGANSGWTTRVAPALLQLLHRPPSASSSSA
jgi:hypothetical protein